MTDPSNAALAYLRYVLDETRQSPTALAKVAGVAPTTLTRPLHNPSHKFALSTTTLAKIAMATGINPAPFFESRDHAQMNTSTIFRHDLLDERWGNQGEGFGGIVVAGEAAAGQWFEPGVADLQKHHPLLLRSLHYAPEDCFGYVVRGNSANKIARDGDTLLCARIERVKQHIQDQDVVVVERRINGGRLIEVTARVLRKHDHGWRLDYPSDDPRFQEALLLNDLEGTEDTKIVGEVLYVVRRPFVDR